METLNYTDENSGRVELEVDAGPWQPTPDRWFRTRLLCRDDTVIGLQKTVSSGQEQRHDRPYAILEHEAHVGMRLALRYRFGYPSTIPRVIGHDIDGAVPFVLYDVPVGRSVARLAGDLGPDRQYPFMRGLFDAVHLLAASGVVHGSLGPETVLWDNGAVRIVDLSTATFAGYPRRSTGVPGYAPPEQTLSAPAHLADDLWGAAALTYFAITGELPRSGLPAMANRGEQLSRLFNELLAPAPEARPSAGTIVARLGGTPSHTGDDLDAALNPGRTAYDELMRVKTGRPFPYGAPRQPDGSPPTANGPGAHPRKAPPGRRWLRG